MQNTYSGVNSLVLAAVLFGAALSLQGCANEASTPGKHRAGSCATAVIETYGVATGKILAGEYGEAKVECNEGLIYQGPDLICVDLAEVCMSSSNECRVTPGFCKQGPLMGICLKTAQLKMLSADREVVDAESKLQAEAAAVALAEDNDVVCTNWPASHFADWAELTAAQQAAATGIGHTKETWDGDKPNPPTDTQKWEELSDPNKKFATALGWTQPVWDGDLADLTAYKAKLKAAEAAENPNKSDAEVKKEVAEDIEKYAVQRTNVGGGIFTPMGVSFVLCMCLVLAVSIRAVRQSRQQLRNVDRIEADPELLEAENIE